MVKRLARYYARAINVLVVCSANICRSRIAEVRLRKELAERSVPASVSSAGTLAGRREVPPQVKELLGKTDARLSEPGRQVELGDLEEADLVICLAREHLRELVVLSPGCWEKTATLCELVRRGSAVGPRTVWEEPSEWLRRVLRGREMRSMVGESPVDDIADPYGGSLADYRRADREITGLVHQLADLIWPRALLESR